MLREGQLNGFFYIVYDGVLEERKGGKVVRRLVPGDYFGEDSLIKTNAAAIDVVAVQYFGGHFTPEDLPAASDVTAVEESRCLAMPGADFLDFFARDFRVSLRMAANARGK